MLGERCFSIAAWPSPLHAARASVGALWALSLTAAALILYHPLCCSRCCSPCSAPAAAAGVGRALARSLRMAAIVALPIVLVNVLVSREGLTVFARLGDLGPFGQGNLTVEALVYGGVIALKVTLLISITSLAGLAVDPDELLRMLPSAVVSLGADGDARDAHAARARRRLPAPGRGPAHAPGRRAGGARGRVALLSAVVGGSLDRAMDVAATLEVRGFATPRRAARSRARRARRARRSRATTSPSPRRRSADPRARRSCAPRSPGAGSFTAYPQIEMPLGSGTLALSRHCSRPRCCRSATAGGSSRERALLSFEHVSYRYPGVERPALSDVSFALEPGEFCLLAGLSGSGKSTLLRAACGLVPHFHGGRFGGRVELAGLDTREHGPARLGAFAGALFQDPETQLVTSSVRAELALALESRGEGATAVARGVEEVALALGIDALLDRSTHELSGGEKQRVALGAALAGRPRWCCSTSPPRSSTRSPATS